MKIIMDMLANQSESSRNRGIGRYSLELTTAISKQLKNDLLLAFNGLYENIDDDKTEIAQKANRQINFFTYHVLDTSHSSLDTRKNYSKLNSLLLSRQFNAFGKNNIVHFHSIFEGFEDKGVVVDDLLDLSEQKTMITLYDLIPFRYPNKYLKDPHVKSWYYKRLRLLYDADILITISESTKEDAINLLGIPQENIHNISAAINTEKFYKMSSKEKENWQPKLLEYDITQEFILYTGGFDFRKNLEASLEAYSKLNKVLLDQYQYVIVCKISKEERFYLNNIIKKLQIPEGKVVFTGFVSDDLLNYLYNTCKLFIFPSLFEGFGLPVLEAMSCGAAVIGSNTSSVPEIIGNDEALFDPKNVEDITQAITRALNDPLYINRLRNHAYTRSKLFSWEKSAQQCITIHKELHKRPIHKHKRFKIAFFSPLPSQRSGISDYSHELLPFLSKYMDIDLYIDDYSVCSDYLNSNYSIYNYREFESRAEQYHQIIYQFGNSEFHAYMYDIALQYSGIVVLHDFFLSGLVSYMTDNEPGNERFFRTLRSTHGEEGEECYQKLLYNKMSVGEIIKKFPLNGEIIESATAVIVHSEYAKALFNSFYEKEYPVHKINQIIKIPSVKKIKNKLNARKQLFIDNETIVISVFGHIAASKQYDFILEVMNEFHFLDEYPVALYFVGDFMDNEYKRKIKKLIHRFELKNRISITGFVDSTTYQNYMLATDICINLRIDSRGETSRALLQNMAYGLPTIVNDYATFSEFPDSVVHKIPLNNKTSFINALKKLINDKEYRAHLSENSYHYILNEHNSDQIARDYYDVIENVVKKDIDESNVTKEIAESIVNGSLDLILKDDDYINIANIIKKSTS